MVTIALGEIVGFTGRSSEYLKYNPLLLCEDLKAILNEHFERFSDLTKEVMSRLCSQV